MRGEEIGKTDKAKYKKKEKKRERKREKENIDEVIATDLVSVYHSALDIHVSSHQSNRSVGRYSCQ